MARDGVQPPALANVHPTFCTPWVITAITGVAVATIGGLVDLETLVHPVSASARCSRSSSSASFDGRTHSRLARPVSEYETQPVE